MQRLLSAFSRYILSIASLFGHEFEAREAVLLFPLFGTFLVSGRPLQKKKGKKVKKKVSVKKYRRN